jgi:hypothetical protein
MRVLSLDGGGVFGFAQARILSESGVVPKFDVFVGTSIGSAIAAMCAIGEEQRVGQAFFDEWMPQIFRYDFWRKINPLVTKYDDNGLNRAITYLFHDRVMTDAGKPLFVTAANIVEKRLKVFSSLDTDASTMYIKDVIRAATAGETYFTPHNHYADGGVFANNPSAVAVAAVCHELDIPLNQIELFSIGTGSSGDVWTYGDPGTSITWLWWVVEASLQGSSSVMPEYLTSCLPLKKNVRIQFRRQPGWGLDNVQGMKIAERMWEDNIQLAIKAITSFCSDAPALLQDSRIATRSKPSNCPSVVTSYRAS